MTTLLLTGFEPFGGDALNPSMLAVQALAPSSPAGLQLAAAVLPVSYARAGAALRAAITRWSPDVVLGTGLASGRTELSVERVAINLDDAPAADNDGAHRYETEVIRGGPAAYFASLPVKAMVAATREEGVPAAVSHTAGTFLCNHIFYLACHVAATERVGMRVGFIHVPALPEMAADHSPAPPSLALPLLIRGLTAAIEAIRDEHPAPTAAAGALY